MTSFSLIRNQALEQGQTLRMRNVSNRCVQCKGRSGVHYYLLGSSVHYGFGQGHLSNRNLVRETCSCDRLQLTKMSS